MRKREFTIAMPTGPQRGLHERERGKGVDAVEEGREDDGAENAGEKINDACAARSRFAPMAETSTGTAAPMPMPMIIGKAVAKEIVPVTESACKIPTEAELDCKRR